MSQANFFDPIVSAGPALVGTGNGTLTVDRLTHFTVAQDYTLTCIAKTPDTLFSVVGSLDGPVGIAKVGTQFFDDDLKIFLTIQQGITVFEVGDIFTLTVDNGTDLNQDNIDSYDEQPQKNFGAGIKGSLAGDHNIRYSDSNVYASLFVDDLKFVAATIGATGQDVQIQYADTIPATYASLNVGGFLYTALVAGSSGNSISIEYVDDVLAGSESVSVLGNAITVHIQDGVSTKSQVQTVLTGSAPVNALVSYVLQGLGSDTVNAFVPDFLVGGADPIGELGDEEAVVVGNLITIYFVSGKSNATALKAAFDTNIAATALASCSIVGDGSNPQYTPYGPTNLSGGKNKFFALNKHELTEAGDFFEGNASAKVEDLHVQGRQVVDGEASFSDAVVLNAANSNKIPDLQRYLQWLIQDEKVTLRTADHTKVEWQYPNLSFDADIVIDFTDTDVTNKIAVADSPISIADGQSAYVILDRANSTYLTVQVAAEVPESINAFRLASRFGDHLILWDNTLVRNGKAVRIGEGGGEGGTVKIDLYDPVSTTLPSGPTATVDGVSVTNGMLVLFSALTVGANKIYSVSGVGVSLVWTEENLYSTGVTPVLGDDVLVKSGTGFGLAHGTFDGTDFNFNDFVRFYSGTDYWELSSLKTSTILASTTDNIFTVNVTGSENAIVDYSIIRGTVKETGTIHITSDGTDVSVTTTGAFIGSSGVTFSGDISGGLLRLRYTADAGSSATMKYFVKRWSDSAGGPAGLPSYSGAMSGISAAGADTQVQYNDAGNFGADANFTWDKVSKVLNLGGLDITSLSAAVTLLDNQPSVVTAFSFPAATYPFVIVDFSVKRNGIYRVGRMLIANDTVDVAYSDDSVTTGIIGTGIVFSGDISGANVVVQYTSTNTGFDGELKYAVRRWS